MKIILKSLLNNEDEIEMKTTDEGIVIRVFNTNAGDYSSVVMIKKSDLENAILALDVLNGSNKP
jgi:hypothetical protein